MADLLDDLQLHEPGGEQTQGPAGVPLRRDPAAQRQELGLGFAALV